MKIVSFLNVIPPKNTNDEKPQILHKYVQGVNAVGDTGIAYSGNSLIDCDVAVIQGWQHESGKTAPHLRLRKQIIDKQISLKKFVCVADSNLFLYANKSNSPHHYLRYSLNGVFPNTGIYCDSPVNPKRWNQLSKDLNIQISPEKRRGKHILICLQRNGGWSMGNLDVVSWTINTIAKIKEHTDRPIVVRTHPGDKSVSKYINQLRKINSIKINVDTDLSSDLENAWCVVNHNSSSIVGPLIMGYPAFITDPINSQCADVSNTDFSKIENPNIYDREAWLSRISMFHWKFSELEDGSCWKHMRNYCQ